MAVATAVAVPQGLPNRAGEAMPSQIQNRASQAAPQVDAQPKYDVETVPSAPSSFPELTDLSEAELDYYKANPGAIADKLSVLPEVHKYTIRAQKAREENVAMANDTIAKEAKFTDVGLECERRNEALSQRQASVQALLARRDEVLQQQSPAQLLSVLQAQAQAAEADAEGCLQQAQLAPQLDGAGLAEFRQRYIRQKADKHMRLALRERLQRGS